MPPQTRVCKGYASAVLMKAVAREPEEAARAQSLPGAAPRRQLCGCETMNNVGLVLSGGGARAAYQVGALRALVEILGSQACPFNIRAGLSAGAINCAALAMHAADFAQAVERLTDTWLALNPGARRPRISYVR